MTHTQFIFKLIIYVNCIACYCLILYGDSSTYNLFTAFHKLEAHGYSSTKGKLIVSGLVQIHSLTIDYDYNNRLKWYRILYMTFFYSKSMPFILIFL